nr:DUF1328 family protein [Chromatocurvus halotolerans]
MTQGGSHDRLGIDVSGGGNHRRCAGTEVAGVATNIAWILFVVGLALAIIFAIRGR